MPFDFATTGRKPTRWWVRPELTAASDLWRGLTGLWDFGDSARQRNDLTGTYPVLTASGSPGVTTTSKGPAAQFTLSTSDHFYLTQSNVSASRLQASFCIVIGDGIGSTSDRRVWAYASSSDNDPVVLIDQQVNNTVARIFIRNNTNNIAYNFSTNADLFDGAVHTLAFAVDNQGSCEVWIDGVHDQTVSTSNSTNGYTLNRLAFGALRRSSASSYWSGDILMAAEWSATLLSSTNLQRVSSDPFALIRPDPAKILPLWFAETVEGVSNTVPSPIIYPAASFMGL